MHHFDNLDGATLDRLFHQLPEAYDPSTAAELQGYWLGATLYMPGNRTALARDLQKQRAAGVLSVVIDFEDGLPDALSDTAVDRIVASFAELALVTVELPMIFLRLRSAEDIVDVASALGPDCSALSGFVFPKFDATENGQENLDALASASTLMGRQLLGMPIVEARAFAHRETRLERLTAMRELYLERRPAFACVRIGGTDLASAFGLRRTEDTTVYDIRVVADAISDTVNIFGRDDEAMLPVSGLVWEHFRQRDRVLKPGLRFTPFVRHEATDLRASLVGRGLDTLLKEINLDKLNGLVGKTVVHPSHVSLVHSLSAVSFEEFEDATSIIGSASIGGALRSPAGNKMNEVRPHLAWAHRVALRARAFGVARDDVDFVDLLLAAEVGQ